MKKLVSWYKKKDKELETHFTAGLLQINFVTNALILLVFYIYFVVSESIYAIKDPFIQFSVWEIIAFTMEILPYGLTIALFVPNILSSFMGSAGGPASSSKKLRKKLSKIRICLRIEGQKKEKGQEKMTHSQLESPSPKPVKRKSNSLPLFFGLVSLVAFSKRFSFSSSRI